MSRVAPLVLLALAACGGGPRQVAVRILVPDLEGSETPIPGVVVVALPYDRDSVLAALERRAGTGRPHAAELDSLFEAFRGPFLAFSRAAWRLERMTRRRDSLVRRGAAAAAGSPAAAELAARLGALDDSLARPPAGTDRGTERCVFRTWPSCCSRSPRDAPPPSPTRSRSAPRGRRRRRLPSTRCRTSSVRSASGTSMRRSPRSRRSTSPPGR